VFVALSVLLAVACLFPAMAKLAGLPRMREPAAHFGIPWRRYQLIGVPELAAGLGVLLGLALHPLGIAAAAGMGLLLIGAVLIHLRAGDGGKELAPALVSLAVTIAYLAVALAG
jgi:DoxX-like family